MLMVMRQAWLVFLRIIFSRRTRFAEDEPVLKRWSIIQPPALSALVPAPRGSIMSTPGNSALRRDNVNPYITIRFTESYMQ